MGTPQESKTLRFHNTVRSNGAPALQELELNKTAAATHGGDGGKHRSVVVLELPLGDSEATFNLEKAVCSHGLFMMAPNHWDPLTKTLQRPLRLEFDYDPHVSVSTCASLIVQISHPSDTPHTLHLHVFDTDFLSPQQEQTLLGQVRRMLRLSEAEGKKLREFWEVNGDAEKKGFGRVFRSPTLFEDMVKCILLCNCQWPRTLSMATALCELQLELQGSLSSVRVSKADNGSNLRSRTVRTEHFIPKTPAGKESNRKPRENRSSKKLANKLPEFKEETVGDADVRMDCAEMSDCLQRKEKLRSSFLSSYEKDFHEQCETLQTSSLLDEIDPCYGFGPESSEGSELHSYNKIGNFPSPRELASLDENFLAKRCSVGYRARRIINLAQSVVEGRIQLRELNHACSTPTLSNYDNLAEQLKEIDGFGPFTCANVLMCMGFYNVIPTDTETLRHLKQVHARKSTISTVQRDVEVIYGNYAPFQFLAYWSEVWHYYEEKFGKLSEMPHSDYRLITATNMRSKKSVKSKRIKIS